MDAVRSGSRGARPWYHHRDRDVFPTVSSVKVGRDGRVWVYPYRKPGAAAGGWWVFGTDGHFLCHLPSAVRSFTPYDFGADYLLGVHADELGVERVVMHELRLPEPGAGQVR